MKVRKIKASKCICLVILSEKCYCTGAYGPPQHISQLVHSTHLWLVHNTTAILTSVSSSCKLTQEKGFSHPILSLNDYWTLETRWSVCECHWWPVVTFDNVGWSGKHQYSFSLPSRRGENSTWIDFIPHSAHSKYFWQRHMVERSAQQQAAQPQVWAVFTSLFQATCTSNVCNVCMLAGRQVGTQTDLAQTHRHRGKW